MKRKEWYAWGMGDGVGAFFCGTATAMAPFVSEVDAEHGLYDPLNH